MSNYQTDTDKELEQVLGSHKTIIRIVGAGGAGNNTVTRLLEAGISDVEVIAVNTDAQDLLYAKANQKILIGRAVTSGLGAGSDPTKGEESAKESLPDIEAKLAGSDMVFITCGLGGGTGTGSAPVIAEVAQKAGALTIAVVTLPFSDEGVVRWENARKGLQQLHSNVDTVIVVQNDKLLDLVPDMPLGQAFKVADEILVNAVKGITELVTEKGLVNLDFADLRTIMHDGGLAMIGLGEGESEANAEEAAEKALQNPLLDVDVTGARSALINISGGQELSLKAAKTVMRIVAKKLDPSARIIWGARVDESMGSKIRVMLIITCLQTSRKSSSEIEMAIHGTKSGSQQQAPKAEAVQFSPAEPPPAQTEQTQAKTVPVATEANKKKASKIFSDIFLEESDNELNQLEDCIKHLNLSESNNNRKSLIGIAQACSALHSSAELFGYEKITDFVDLIQDVTEYAEKGQFELSKSLVDLYRQIPRILRAMMTDDPVGFDQAEEVKQKLENILELVVQAEDAKRGGAATNELNSGEKLLGDEALSQPDSPALKRDESEFDNVSQAVKYFNKLF